MYIEFVSNQITSHKRLNTNLIHFEILIHVFLRILEIYIF